MEKVWIARVITEAYDKYTFTSKSKLTRQEIAKRIWETEGKCEDLEFYEKTCSIEMRDFMIPNTNSVIHDFDKVGTF